MPSALFMPRVPPPRAAPACASCRTFVAEVLVPVGHAGAAELCWLCAHHVADHGVAVERAALSTCRCPLGDIYPADARPDQGWRCETCGRDGEPVPEDLGCVGCGGVCLTRHERELEQVRSDFADLVWAGGVLGRSE